MPVWCRDAVAVQLPEPVSDVKEGVGVPEGGEAVRVWLRVYDAVRVDEAEAVVEKSTDGLWERLGDADSVRARDRVKVVVVDGRREEVGVREGVPVPEAVETEQEVETEWDAEFVEEGAGVRDAVALRDSDTEEAVKLQLPLGDNDALALRWERVAVQERDWEALLEGELMEKEMEMDVAEGVGAVAVEKVWERERVAEAETERDEVGVGCDGLGVEKVGDRYDAVGLQEAEEVALVVRERVGEPHEWVRVGCCVGVCEPVLLQLREGVPEGEPLRESLRERRVGVARVDSEVEAVPVALLVRLGAVRDALHDGEEVPLKVPVREKVVVGRTVTLREAEVLGLEDRLMEREGGLTVGERVELQVCRVDAVVLGLAVQEEAEREAVNVGERVGLRDADRGLALRLREAERVALAYLEALPVLVSLQVTVGACVRERLSETEAVWLRDRPAEAEGVRLVEADGVRDGVRVVLPVCVSVFVTEAERDDEGEADKDGLHVGVADRVNAGDVVWLEEAVGLGERVPVPDSTTDLLGVAVAVAAVETENVGERRLLLVGVAEMVPVGDR